MSALRDGESRSDVGDEVQRLAENMPIGYFRTLASKNSTCSSDISSIPMFRLKGHSPIWRRLWFLVSCIPRYLITGSVEVP